MRADWKAIRAVYKTHGHALARVWSETPLLDLTGLERRNIPAFPGALDHLPLDPLVLRPPHGGNNVPYSVLIETEPAEGAKDAFGSGDAQPFNAVFALELDKSVFRGKQLLHRVLGGGAVVACLFDNRSGRVLIPRAYLDAPAGARVKMELNLSHMLGNALNAISVVDVASKHAVEVAEVGAPATGQKTADRKKPWLTSGLRQIIVINLADAKKYGHRISCGGTHASPRPHTRRGHYVRLRSERYGKNRGRLVWRKQAWVGDTEWLFEGRQYRVLGVES